MRALTFGNRFVAELPGDNGAPLTPRQVTSTPSDFVRTLSVLAFESGDAQRIEAVLTLAATKPELGRDVVSARGWLPAAIASNRLAPLQATLPPRLARLARLDTRCGG